MPDDPPRGTDEWRDALANAYAIGTPVKDIARDLGCAMTYPGHIAQRRGIRLRRAGARWMREQRQKQEK